LLRNGSGGGEGGEECDRDEGSRHVHPH
jgi:hypothetical protein